MSVSKRDFGRDKIFKVCTDMSRYIHVKQLSLHFICLLELNFLGWSSFTFEELEKIFIDFLKKYNELGTCSSNRQIKQAL